MKSDLPNYTLTTFSEQLTADLKLKKRLANYIPKKIDH